MKIPMIGLRSEFCKGRPPGVYGKSYSTVLFGKCNYKCKFCYERGDKADGSGTIPGSKMMNFEDIDRWVSDEAKKGIPIKVTGGEASLFPDPTMEILKTAKRHGAYTQLDTNGSRPEIVIEFAKHLNAIGLDIKGSEYNIEYLTGAPKELSLAMPVQTLRLSKDFPCLVEFKTVMFDFTDLDHLEWLYNLMPRDAYWEWKQYRPFEGVERTPKKINLKPAPEEQIIKQMKEMCRRYPELEKNNRIVAIVGSSKDYRNFRFPKDLKR